MASVIEATAPSARTPEGVFERWVDVSSWAAADHIV
jgi:hypothetical protein